MVRIYTAYERDKGELSALNPSVVVEMWDFLQHSMSRKRKYNELFSAQERNLIRMYYHDYRRWVIVTGFPEEVRMLPSTYALLKRAGDFFAAMR